MAHFEPPCQDLRCLPIQLFSSLVFKELRRVSLSITNRYKCYSSSRFKYTSCDKDMKHYNPDIATACKESTWPYKRDFYLSKNVFCVMCAKGLLNASTGLCTYPDERANYEGYTILLDYTSLSTDPTEVESKCGLDEIFDEFMVRIMN